MRDEVGPGAQFRGGELRDADAVAEERPLRVRRRRDVLRVKEQNPEPCADRQRIVPRRFDQPELLQLGQLLGHLRREVVGLRPVLVQVVELPGVLVGRPLEDAGRQSRDPRGARAHGAGKPALVVDAAASERVEVLGLQAALGGWIVEGVGQAHAVDRVLGNTVDLPRRCDPENLVDRRARCRCSDGTASAAWRRA